MNWSFEKSKTWLYWPGANYFDHKQLQPTNAQRCLTLIKTTRPPALKTRSWTLILQMGKNYWNSSAMMLSPRNNYTLFMIASIAGHFFERESNHSKSRFRSAMPCHVKWNIIIANTLLALILFWIYIEVEEIVKGWLNCIKTQKCDISKMCSKVYSNDDTEGQESKLWCKLLWF